MHELARLALEVAGGSDAVVLYIGAPVALAIIGAAVAIQRRRSAIRRRVERRVKRRS